MVRWVRPKKMFDERPKLLRPGLSSDNGVVEHRRELEDQSWDDGVRQPVVTEERRGIEELHRVAVLRLQIAEQGVKGADARKYTRLQSVFPSQSEKVAACRYKKERVSMDDDSVGPLFASATTVRGDTHVGVARRGDPLIEMRDVPDIRTNLVQSSTIRSS